MPHQITRHLTGTNLLRMRILLFILFSLLWAGTQAQTCTEPGQTPATAFPVCGTAVFVQKTVPLCGGRKLPNPNCLSDGLTDVNPFYYKFTCFEAGTLGFSIRPSTNSDDYDWEVYDITDRNPEDIFTDASLIVASNWSGEGGETGAGTQGKELIICGGFGKPLWSTMPQLKKGHKYLLLVSHFTPSQSGYELEFKGGTAVITDPVPPALKAASAHCNAQTIRISLNKSMRCNSLAADGSDFMIMPGNLPIAGAKSVKCSGGFDTDSVEVRLVQPLDPGNYQVVMRKGSDNNTLLDNCGASVAESQALSFTVFPNLPTKLDSIAPVGCKPSHLQLVFKRPIYCNTVAPDGSDFVVTGPYAVTIKKAAGECSGGLSEVINLELDAPMMDAGLFKVTLRRNAGGGTPLDECGNPIPEGSVNFQVADTVSPRFTYNITYGCDQNRVQFNHAGTRGVNQWQWQLDDGKSSNQQNPNVVYTAFDTKNIELVVSNGVCTDSASVQLVMDNFLSVHFDAVAEECPNEPVQFKGAAVGQGLQHRWQFGDGGGSTDAQPVYRYPAPERTRTMEVRYTVTDRFGCRKTMSKPITIFSSCTVYIPNAFTPGGDGRNDRFRPLNAFRVEQYEFVVYNRWGQEVFRTRDPKQGWDGTVKGIVQATGTYVWSLRYREINSGRSVTRKGSIVLIK